MSISDVIETYGQTIAEESNDRIVLRVVRERRAVTDGSKVVRMIEGGPWRRVLALPVEVARDLDGVTEELPAAKNQQAQHRTMDLAALGWDLFEYQPASEDNDYPVLVRDFGGALHSCANDDSLLDLVMRLDETTHAKKRRVKMLRDLLHLNYGAIGQVGLQRSEPVRDVMA